MARTVRDAEIGTREKRLKLKVGRRHWRSIQPGLAIGYRRGTQGAGSWLYRHLLSSGKYELKTIGTADDHTDANGADVLTFADAQRKAMGLADDAKRADGTIASPLTVVEAVEKYLAWFREHRKSVTETEKTINAHIVPALGKRTIASLTRSEIETWLDKIARAPARVRAAKDATAPAFRAAAKTENQKRARKATANRVFNVLKAILNRAFQKGLVSDDTAWRQVRPFKKVDQPRIRFLTDAEAARLVNACPVDLRALIRAALLTGARYGELVALKAGDVKPASIYIAEAKSGRPRHVPLNPEGTMLFREVITGKLGEDLVFTKADGSAWGKNHHVKPLAAACKVAKIRPASAFHELRHTYASHLAQAGVELLTISKLLGHADTRITSRHYAHLADKTLAAAVTKLPSFTGAPILAAVPAKRVTK